MEQRHSGGLGAHQKARLQEKHIQRHGFHGHGFAAHVGTGDDGSAPIQRDGHGDKGSPLLRQQVDEFRVHHILQHQFAVGDLGQHAAVADGEQRLLHHEVQTAQRLRVSQQIIHHGSQLGTHDAAHLHLLALLLGADTGALEPQVVLFRVGLGMEQPLLHVLLGGANFFQLLGGAVRDVKATASGVVGVENIQRGGGIVEGRVLQARRFADGIQQRTNIAEPLEVALDLEQLHMIRHLAVLAAAQGVADILDLAQQRHQAGEGILQFLVVDSQRLHVVQLRFQRGALVRGIEPQAADALQPKGGAAVQRLQRVLQADLDLFVKGYGDHRNSSFTLMTGASTAAVMAAINASLSKRQP